jgi:hypothetical protein
MQMHWKSNSRRLLVACAALLLSLAGIPSFAQTSNGTGTLAVTATVTGSIQLTFSTDIGPGVGLTGSGTSSATLGFGSITAYQSSTSTVTINDSPSSGLCTTCFSASTPVNIVVNLADSSSATFNLQGYVSTPTAGEKLAVGGATLGTSSGSPTSIANGLSYGSNTETVTIGIQTGSSGAATYSDTITLIAIAA